VHYEELLFFISHAFLYILLYVEERMSSVMPGMKSHYTNKFIKTNVGDGAKMISSSAVTE